MFMQHQIKDVFGMPLRMGIKFLQAEVFMDKWHMNVVLLCQH